MNLKKKVLQHGMKLMSSPSVMKLIQDDRFTKAVVTALSLPGRITSAAQEHTDRIAHMMSLATEQEVRDLRRTVRSLEHQISELKHELERSRENINN